MACATLNKLTYGIGVATRIVPHTIDTTPIYKHLNCVQDQYNIERKFNFHRGESNLRLLGEKTARKVIETLPAQCKFS